MGGEARKRADRVPIIIDTDVGADPDDAFALAFALASPEFDVAGVTVVTGDVELRARMAARLLGMAGRADIPVFRGRSDPLDPNGKPAMLGTEGQGLLDLPYLGPEATIHDLPAPEWLVQRTTTNPVHLVAIGPLTNVAAALRLDLGLTDRLLSLTVMSGVYDLSMLSAAWQRAIDAEGPAAWPDYNTASDAEAALTCGDSGFPITWVTTETTLRVPLLRSALDRLDHRHPLGLALRRMTEVWRERWFGGTQPAWELDANVPEETVCFLHDPLTVSALLPQSGRWLRLRGCYGLGRLGGWKPRPARPTPRT